MNTNKIITRPEELDRNERVLYSGNHYISVPIIDCKNGAIKNINITSLSCKALVELKGRQFLFQPFFYKEGNEVKIKKVDISKEHYYLPQLTFFLENGIKITARIYADLKEKGLIYDFEASEKLEIRLYCDIRYVSLLRFNSHNIEARKLLKRDKWLGNPVIDIVSPGISFAMAFGGSEGLTLSNRNFIYYLISYLTIWFGINTLTIAMPYISEILLKIPPESSGFLIAGAFVIAVVFSPLLPRITLKYGKKNVMIMTSIMFGFILISTGFFGTLFGQITATVIVLIAGIPLSATFVVPNAIVADIAEWDGIEKGQQREGMFFGTQGLIIKIVIGLSSFVTPLVFKTFGYTGANPLGLQLCGPISGVLVLTGIIFMRRYSLPEE
jgi:hypothetical protein